MKPLFILTCLCSLAFAAKQPNVTLEVKVIANDTRAVRLQGTGLVGAIAGARTEQVVFGLNVIINDKHVKLSCFENHRGCPSFETD